MRRFFYDTEFIERPGRLDLISIGVVGEDGREFYAVSGEFDHSAASDWVKANVLAKLEPPTTWKLLETIRLQLLDFLKPSVESPIELWGYYSAYDHVALCWLFGTMMDLPAGMPMWTNDIQQIRHAEGVTLPVQESGHHNALADARWTKLAYESLVRGSR